MRTRLWPVWSVAVGLGVAALYTLTPLTICVIVAGATLLPLFGRGLGPRDRRWLFAIVGLALAARLVAIGAIFAREMPNHDDLFVGATAGDESYTMSRALRTRAILRGGPVTLYDYFVAFDEYGRNSYTAAATTIQTVFGPTPYSLRLANTLLFTIGALLLFRLCLDAFGALPAFGGLVVVLFWPSLFVWSTSLLKEALYFVLGALILVAGVAVIRRRGTWWAVAVAMAAAAAIAGLRPGAVPLVGAGLVAGAAGYALLASKRTIALTAIGGIAVCLAAMAIPAVSERLVRSLEAAAKTHSGHVFTVGHDYKLLDAGFYLIPQTPSSSTLTLTGPEATRFAARAFVSFLAVPAPWQLQSWRELAYLPEQLLWYTLVVLLPIGVAAGWRRDRLVTCMLVGFAVPTGVALALTNGNVGTLLRLRGLVVPYLVWTSVVGFCAVLNTPGQKGSMRVIDENGRVFGRINLFDAAVAGFAIVLIPLAYGTFLLFRVPKPQIASVTRVPVTREERRVAGGNRLTAKLKVRGSGLRPMLTASIDDAPALGFVFESPNSADVMVGEVPPGAHDLVLRDGVQEVARLPKAVTIEASAPPRVIGIGSLIRLERTIADALTPDAGAAALNAQAILRLGPVEADAGGFWRRPAEIALQCDPDPNDEGCAVGGVPMTPTSAAPPVVRLTLHGGTAASFAIAELLPPTPPQTLTLLVRGAAEPEVAALIHAGDRDALLDDRAATVVDVGRRRAGGDVDVTLHVGADASPAGFVYRGRALKAGAPFTLTTDRYVVNGSIVEIRGTGATK